MGQNKENLISEGQKRAGGGRGNDTNQLPLADQCPTSLQATTTLERVPVPISICFDC